MSNHNSSVRVVQVEVDDDDAWVPLSTTPSTDGPTSRSAASTSTSTSATTASTQARTTSASSSAMTAALTTSSPQQQETRRRQQSLQRRLESRIHLKSTLVDHPIDLFWKRFLWNLACEVWALEWYIRLGLVLVVSGILMKLLLVSTWYFWYPRVVLTTVVLLAATIYLDIFGIQQQVDHVSNILGNPDRILQLAQQLDATGIRRLAGVLLLLPTLLEMRTLSFLSGIKAESGWITYNVILSIVLLASMMYWLRVKRVAPRECLYRGLLVLYGSALLVTIGRTDVSRLPLLAAPFFTATGTLLITYQDDDMEWMSRVVRHALRLTLKDVLSSMSSKVSQDELLQLAVLRWIVDYWASIPTNDTPVAPVSPSGRAPPSAGGAGSPAPSSSVPQRHSPSEPETSASAATNPTAPNQNMGNTDAQPPHHSVQSVSTVTADGRRTRLSRQSAAEVLGQQRVVSWEELMPMLSIATEHMTSEVRLLQNGTGSPPTGTTPSSTTTAPSSSFDGLHDMLGSLNVDERAEPAVRAYQQAIEAVPPSRQSAFLLSLLRRCPAVLTVVWQIVSLRSGVLLSALVLVPFCVLEFYRILEWIQTCDRMKPVIGDVGTTTETDNDTNTQQPQVPHSDSELWWVPTPMRDADPMLILLCGDSYSAVRPPALLLVWQNIASSVSALQVGLTAARCAETTASAVQFAGNVMSLVQFGHEIHQHGLLHGLVVMAKEAIVLQTVDETLRHREATKYTHAAMGAMTNAQRVARNMQTLADDDKVGHVVQPLVWAMSALMDLGRSWGQGGSGEATATEAADPTTDSSFSAPVDSLPPQASKGKSNDNKSPTADPPQKDPSAEAANADTQTQVDGIADVMDEIADSYANQLITESEKDDLLGQLSRISSEDMAALNGMHKSLEACLQKEPKPSILAEPQETTHISPSAVMELVLAAYYRGLIDQTEKAAFCERIADLSDDDRSNPSIVGGMVRTLEAILGLGEESVSASLPVLAVTGFAKELEEPDSKVKGVDAEETAEGSNSGQADIKLEEECASASSENVALDLIENNSSASEPSEPTIARAMPSDATTTSNTIPTMMPGISVGSAEQGNDTWLRLGMATLGVVGGILLSKQKDEGQSENSQHNESGSGDSTIDRATVQIEEIREEPEEDWISVPQ